MNERAECAARRVCRLRLVEYVCVRGAVRLHRRARSVQCPGVGAVDVRRNRARKQKWKRVAILGSGVLSCVIWEIVRGGASVLIPLSVQPKFSHLDHDWRPGGRLAERGDRGTVPHPLSGGGKSEREQLLSDGDAVRVEGGSVVYGVARWAALRWNSCTLGRKRAARLLRCSARATSWRNCSFCW